MARKKAEVTEDIKEVEVVETPVAKVVEDKPKKSRKKKVEEPVAEEVPVAKPVVEEPVAVPEVIEEVKVEEPVVEEVKPVKVKKAKKVEEPIAKPVVTSSTYKAVATKTLYVLKVPGALATKIGSYKAGIKFEILEEQMGWGKIADGKWVNLNYIEKI